MSYGQTNYTYLSRIDEVWWILNESAGESFNLTWNFQSHESNKWYIVLDELSDVFMAQENFKLRVGLKASYLLFPAKPQNVPVMSIFQSYVLFFIKANNFGIQ